MNFAECCEKLSQIDDISWSVEPSGEIRGVSAAGLYYSPLLALWDYCGLPRVQPSGYEMVAAVSNESGGRALQGERRQLLDACGLLEEPEGQESDIWVPVAILGVFILVAFLASHLQGL